MSDELVPVTVKVRQEMLLAIDAAQSVHGEGRAQFIRNAIAERVASLGVSMTQSARFAPDRAGKGGQPTHKRNQNSEEIPGNLNEPSSFPDRNSVPHEKMGQKRKYPEGPSATDRTESKPSGTDGSDYVAPSAVVPPQKREVPDEVLPGHSPEAREAILSSIPVAMRIARERKATDDKRAAYAKVKAEKKAAEEAERKRRAAEWHVKQAAKGKTK